MGNGGEWKENPKFDPNKKSSSRNPRYSLQPTDFVPKVPTPEEINVPKKGIGFDAIDRGILIEQRLKRFGIPKNCPDCGGKGELFIEPEAHLNLILWVLHPRKGASRAIEYVRILEEDLPSIYTFLKEARKRNNKRFAKIK